MTANIGSFLLGTRRAARLRRWYQDAFAGIETEHGGLRFGDVVLAIDERPDLLVAPAEPSRLSIAFRVPSLEATALRLEVLGARWLGPSTVADPDGNVVHVLEEPHSEDDTALPIDHS